MYVNVSLNLIIKKTTKTKTKKNLKISIRGYIAISTISIAVSTISRQFRQFNPKNFNFNFKYINSSFNFNFNFKSLCTAKKNSRLKIKPTTFLLTKKQWILER